MGGVFADADVPSTPWQLIQRDMGPGLGLVWEYAEHNAVPTFSARTSEPLRLLTITAEDDGFLLTITAAPPANVQGQTRRYEVMVPLLVVLTLLPAQHHQLVIDWTEMLLYRARDGGMLAALQQVIDQSIREWPGPSVVPGLMAEASAHAATVERLSVDLAAADAWREIVPI